MSEETKQPVIETAAISDKVEVKKPQTILEFVQALAGKEYEFLTIGGDLGKGENRCKCDMDWIKRVRKIQAAAKTVLEANSVVEVPAEVPPVEDLAPAAETVVAPA